MTTMRTHGFTLLELLLVILITGTLAAVVAPIINEPIRAYFDQTTRATLVDAAEAALRRMQRDVRRALPFSIRINGARTAMELVRVSDVARYRRQGGGPAGNDERLRIGNNQDDEFNILGRFDSFDTTSGNHVLSGDERLVVFNLGVTPYSIYAGDDDNDGAAVVTPDNATITVTISNDAGFGEDHIDMNPEHEFQIHSFSNRVYIAETAVSYACTGGGLFRDENYGYLATQPTPATVAGGVLMTDQVDVCRFDYDPGSGIRPGLLIMSLTLTNDGESVTLLHQVHVPNTS